MNRCLLMSVVLHPTKADQQSHLLGRRPEAHLLLAYEVLSAHGDEPSTVATLRRLVELYEAWGKRDKVEEWRAKTASSTGDDQG